MTKRKSRNYKNEFKREAVKLVTEQGYSVAEDAQNLGVNPKIYLVYGRRNQSSLRKMSTFT